MKINRNALFIVAAAALIGLSGCGAAGSPAPSTAAASAPAADSTSSSPVSPASPMSSAPTGAMEGMGSMDGAAADTIHIQNSAFHGPASVAPGAAVPVMNMDSEGYTIASDDGTTFNLDVKAGQTLTFTAPDKPGRYAYHCVGHNDMQGTLTVR